MTEHEPTKEQRLLMAISKGNGHRWLKHRRPLHRWWLERYTMNQIRWLARELRQL